MAPQRTSPGAAQTVPTRKVLIALQLGLPARSPAGLLLALALVVLLILLAAEV
jgi:hypothetical protein